jgi:hypothetical protein
MSITFNNYCYFLLTEYYLLCSFASMPKKPLKRSTGATTISISVPRAFVDAVRKRAKSLDLSVSAHARKLIREDIKQAASNTTARAV